MRYWTAALALRVATAQANSDVFRYYVLRYYVLPLRALAATTWGSMGRRRAGMQSTEWDDTVVKDVVAEPRSAPSVTTGSEGTTRGTGALSVTCGSNGTSVYKH